MSNPENSQIGFLIDLLVVRQTDAKQFEEVMDLIENEPDIAMLYQKALGSEELLKRSPGRIVVMGEQTREDEQARALTVKEYHLQKQNHLDLGM